jgi:hypothetical protein
MAPEYFARFMCLCAAGIGMLLAGGINCALRSNHGLYRILTCLAVVACAATGVYSLTGNLGLTAQAAGLMAAAMVVCLLAGSARLAAAATAAARLARRPQVRWGLLAAAGFAVVVGSVAAYEAADDAALDDQLRDLDAATLPRVPAPARATTDRGTPVLLQESAQPREQDELASAETRFFQHNPLRDRVIRQHPGDDRTNCHGWVFTGGRYWVGGDQVELILTENGYRPVSDPRPSDLIVYQNTAGVAHTAVVRYVTEGMPVLIEGKWGASGVYLHAVNESCYGTAYTFYRSHRPGHLLAGVGGPAVNRNTSASADG